MLEQSLTLPCGHMLPNRFCKAAMTEGLADALDRPTAQHLRLYERWARGGAGLLLTGNIMIDQRYLERAGNVVVQDDSVLPALREWADVVHAGGAQLWAQISHPGRQCPRLVNLTPIAPSPVQLDILGNFGKPRAATQQEIEEVIARFAETADLVQRAGLDGVQIHAAHGYLLSQFLSPRTNQRNDAWGGPLAHRARLLLAVVKAVRERVGAAYPISVKLNSSDFVKGGFTLEECLQVVAWLNDAGIDLLEISGGTYEQVEFFRQTPDREVRDSTRQREAMFLQYAAAIQGVARMPLMVTGGFRTRAGMEAALAAGQTDMVGIARPFCVDPDFPSKMLAGQLDTLPHNEDHLRLGTGYWGPNSPSAGLRGLNNYAHAGWYYHQIERMGAGQAPEQDYGPLNALLAHLWHDTGRALRRKRAR
ncbi:NADH:flavin oxidoreductase/NADH oxidase family protein [Chitinimonas sp.]|uniref:NADH:flavin oxidoreductase/NADH oxidase family protein n=1 Tax=Chitinimonas sp. TaxID=1934313 RepID=UPI002F9382F8